jgi:hypothetical protein
MVHLKRGGAVSLLFARVNRASSLCEQNPSTLAHSPCFYVQQYSIDFDDAERRLIESYSASAALQAKPVIRSFHRDADQWDMVGPSCRARGLFKSSQP